MKLSVVIQAGGESRRMGSDKGLIPFLGQPLIQRVIERIGPLANELLITSNQPEAYQFLGLPVFADLLPGRGALGGIYTALAVAGCPLVAVVACDMAFANRNMLSAQRAMLLNEGLDGVVPDNRPGLEPFHAVYRREPCLSAVRQALDSGQKRADAWFPAVKMGYFPPEQIALLDPAGETFININTPADLRLAELRAKRS